MEDLFSRIFTINPEERINWVEIREHALFKKHFPIIHESSKILYKKKGTDNRLVSFVQKKVSMIVKPPKKEEPKVEEAVEDIPTSIVMRRKKDKSFPEEKRFL